MRQNQFSYTPRMQRRGALTKIILALLFCVAVVYAVALITSPWSFHIGGRWTPMLIWQGSGKLHTQGGIEYPLYVYFYPSPHSSRLHLDGLRPTGGLQGSGWLCTSPGVMQRLNLSGTIFGGWRSTDDSLMSFRLLEPRPINLGQQQGYFDLYGRWRGPELVMDDRGRASGLFRSGLRIEHASVTLDWGGYSDFKAACGNTAQR